MESILPATSYVPREHRVPQQVPAYVVGEQCERIACSTTDLSRSGVGLIAPPVLPEGACVSVTLRLGGVDTTAMSGTVCWSGGGRVGVRLDRLDHRLVMRLAAEEARTTAEAAPLESIDEPSEAALWAEVMDPLPPLPRLPRFRDQLPALVSTGGTFWSHATIMNVSGGGVGVFAGVVPPVGEVMHLEVTLPDGSEIRVAGTVAWAACAADDVPLMLAGVTLHYAEETFHRYVLERENGDEQSI